MTKKNEIDQYYVIGNPVKHSLSPIIHRAFAKETNERLSYDALEIAIDQFDHVMKQIKENPSIKGLSVTVPFKERAFKLCDSVDDYAKETGAVSNIIIIEKNKKRAFYGINLDGVSLVLDLKEKGIELKDKSVLILGAGGAARGILLPIYHTQPKSISILNRTEKKAIDLINDFKKNKNNENLKNIKIINNNDKNNKFDIIINTTSASLNNTIPDFNENFVMTKFGTQNTIGYDMAYLKSGEKTAFVKYLEQRGCQSFDGQGMLLALSKEIFFRWRGIYPESNPLNKRLI